MTPGQTLAVISSQELAEAQMKYLSKQAMLEVDHQKLRRTEKLVDLGSAYLPLAEGEGRFVERAVTLGSAVGDAIQVLKGLKPGDRVVTEGSVFLRAEAGRLRSGG